MCYQCRRNSPELLTLEKERKLSCRLCKAFPGIDSNGLLMEEIYKKGSAWEEIMSAYNAENAMVIRTSCIGESVSPLHARCSRSFSVIRYRGEPPNLSSSGSVDGNVTAHYFLP